MNSTLHKSADHRASFAELDPEIRAATQSCSKAPNADLIHKSCDTTQDPERAHSMNWAPLWISSWLALVSQCRWMILKRALFQHAHHPPLAIAVRCSEDVCPVIITEYIVLGGQPCIMGTGQKSGCRCRRRRCSDGRVLNAQLVHAGENGQELFMLLHHAWHHVLEPATVTWRR